MFYIMNMKDNEIA